MKKLLFLVFVLNATIACSQNIGIGTTSPSASAVLDITSSTKGFLPPRMSYSEVLSIISPAPGLIVFNTTFNKPVYFDSLKWRFFNDAIMKVKIGDLLFGGIVFYIDPTERHGLVAALTDQSTNAAWRNGSNILTGAFSSSEGAGNTTAIISFQGNTGVYAAKLCRDYRGGGYTDWYLPAKDQLNLLFGQRNITSMTQNVYWSSTEVDMSMAVDQDFFAGQQINTVKSFGDYVRAIRSF